MRSLKGGKLMNRSRRMIGVLLLAERNTGAYPVAPGGAGQKWDRLFVSRQAHDGT
jgi:hypothetical protein